MTAPKPASEAKTTVISLSGKHFDPQKASAYLADIFGLWERGKIARGTGYTASPAEWGEIVKRTFAFCNEVAGVAISEVATPLCQAVFSELARQGYTISSHPPGQGKPAWPVKKQPIMAMALDSEAIVKTIGEELRKMFDAGLEQGKSATDAVIEAGKLAKPSGEIVKVQRNGAGEIVGAVKQLVYNGNAGA